MIITVPSPIFTYRPLCILSTPLDPLLMYHLFPFIFILHDNWLVPFTPSAFFASLCTKRINLHYIA